MHIVYVSDGKAGHRSQAVGLCKAMQRLSKQEVTFQEVAIEQLPLFSVFKSILTHQVDIFESAPDYIFGVGSHTQLRVLLLGKVYPKAKTVILMKPNFPFGWFDHVIIPEHDGVSQQGNVVLSRGALNPIVNEQRHQQNRILIALGGSSKRHVWSEDKVLNAIEQIVRNNPQADIILTTSRRTPSVFLEHLLTRPYAHQLKVFPVEETPQGWIFEEMQKAEAVWVTEDSVSMMFEALTAGCKVGVIAVDRLKQDRIVKAVDQLLEKQVVSDGFEISHLGIAPEMNEANDVASRLLTSI